MPRKINIDSFGNQLFSALLEGSQRRIELPFPSYRKAISFRHRVYELRKAMMTQKHPKSRVVALARITVTWDPKAPIFKNSKNVAYPQDSEIPATVIIQPNDSEFDDILKAAGVPIKDLSIDPLDEIVKESSKKIEPEYDIKSILDKYKPDDEKKS